MQDEDDQNRNNDTKPHGPGKGERGKEARRQADARRERAAKTLRENLLRRKQQGRARRAGDADETSGLPAAKSDESAE
jgi:hypothetical protein